MRFITSGILALALMAPAFSQTKPAVVPVTQTATKKAKKVKKAKVAKKKVVKVTPVK